MTNYDKAEIKKQLDIEDIYTLLVEFGGEPEYTNSGIISLTIDHNPAHQGSRKLYYWKNSELFTSFTSGEDSFDIFELVQKVSNLQWNNKLDLNGAIRWIAIKFGITSGYKPEDEKLNNEDWQTIDRYNRIKDIELKNLQVQLKAYDDEILNKLRYDIRLTPWLNEGITQEVLNEAKIGYWLGGDQITIPHFDKDWRFVGLRGRTMCKDEANLYGKYRPVKILGIQYNHPLGMNLYNLNFSQNNIQQIQKAIIFESEKSCLLFRSYFGKNADISVACCGNNVSAYQIQMLLDAGAKEIVIAFDRDFSAINDEEWLSLTKNYIKIHKKYKNYALISFIIDKNMITGLKDSPIDDGKEKFLQLFQERVVL